MTTIPFLMGKTREFVFVMGASGFWLILLCLANIYPQCKCLGKNNVIQIRTKRILTVNLSKIPSNFQANPSDATPAQ